MRLDELTTVRFIREPNPFPSFPGQESLTVRFEDGHRVMLICYLEGLYDEQRLRPERLRAWEELRRHYGGRDISAVVDGSLQVVAAAA